MNANAKQPNEILIAAVVMGILYLLNAAGQVFPGAFYFTAAMNNVGGLGGERTIELVEASMWILSLWMFVYLLVLSWRSGSPPISRFWFAFFVLLCFVAAGEELSWGQHLGLVTPSETMKIVNAQSEFNFHNLNIALLLGLSPDHALYSRLDNFNKILNPAFYLLCITAWLIIPAMKRRGRGTGSRWLRHFPVPARQISTFFAANLAAYIVVDRLLYDVGELFEFAVAITMMFAAMDFLRRDDVWHGGGESARRAVEGLGHRTGVTAAGVRRGMIRG